MSTKTPNAVIFGYDPGSLIPGFFNILYLFNSLCESEGFQLLTGIAAGFGEFEGCRSM